MTRPEIDRRQFLAESWTVPGAVVAQSKGPALAVRESLITVRTEDQLELSGLRVEPADVSVGAIVVWVHGASGNFYIPAYVEIARATAARGLSFLSVNTRMHDIGSDLTFGVGGNRRGGGYWGLPSKETVDIAAWVARAAALGYSRVVLVGHSAGGAGARRYVADRQDSRVIGLALASVGLGPAPPKPTPELLKTADDMVAAGRGEDFLPGMRLSAQTYADYGHTPEDLWDFYGSRGTPNPGISRVRCPLLAWFGSDDVGTAADLEQLRKLIARNGTGPTRVTTRIIEGADHLYRGAATKVADLLVDWSRDISTAVPR